MSEVWGPVIAGIGLLATVVFGVQNERRGRYERVLALLQQLSTGEERASRHALGRYVYGGYPDLAEGQRLALVDDYFVVAASIRRVRSTLSSVRGRWPLNGPARLLAESSDQVVGFFGANCETLATRLDIVDVDRIHADVAELQSEMSKILG